MAAVTACIALWERLNKPLERKQRPQLPAVAINRLLLVHANPLISLGLIQIDGIFIFIYGF